MVNGEKWQNDYTRMSIKYKLHQNPRGSSRDGQTAYHPRIDAHKSVARLKQLQRAMGGRQKPLAQMVWPTLMEVQDAMLRLFAEGKSVCLPEIGTFTPQLSGAVSVRADGQPHATDVHVSSIAFRPDPDLLRKAAAIPTKASDRIHVTDVNPEVLEQWLTSHFATHETLSRHQLIHDIYKGIISTYRANRIIARLVAEGRLIPVGSPHSSKRCYRLT